jgi:CheY-like chemotaxis protein/CheY-specific phosphatase CheX
LGVDGELIDECGELLAGLRADIPNIAKRSQDNGALVRMQRHAHTVKGLVGFLERPEMSSLAGRLEETLRRLRDGEAVFTNESLDEIAGHTTKLTEMLAAVGGSVDAASALPCPTAATRPVSPHAGQRETPAPSGWESLAASAARPQIEALSKAIAEVLASFGLAEVVCAEEPGVRDVSVAASDLTVVANLHGDVHGAIVLGFDSSVAQALAAKIAAFMFGEAVEISDDEASEHIRGALGEMVSFTVLAMLNSLGIPPEFAAPHFVKSKGARLSPGSCAASVTSVSTELGGFWVAFAPGGALCEETGGAGQGNAAQAAYRRRVVIADDSSVMRKTIERVLVAAGYEVVAHAADGRQAIEEFRRHRPDLLVLDISMPVMGGLDALRVIRAEDPTARVLVCSAIADTGTVGRTLKGGAVGYVTKPFKPDELVEIVDGFFKEPEPATVHRSDEGPPALGVPMLGTYRVGAPLGEGGMAVVYEGFDPGLGRKVALKVINEEFAGDVEFVVQFLEEARAVARVSAPNVVSIYFAGSDKGKHFFAMELLPGPDLEELVNARGPVPVEKALACVRQGALGLDAAARQGLIHCDVKPSNLVFGSDGLVKVTDFGISRRIGTKDDPTISGATGTPCFMSPEQVMEQAIDHRSDIYSLGTTLYFLLTGDPPYDGEDGVEVALRHVHDPVPTLAEGPRGLRRLVARMMAKSPGDRHADYGELLKDIERLL